MNKAELLHLWQYLHEHGETSMNEVETTNYLVKLFENNGFQPKRFKHIPGFYVELGTGVPKVGLRADMDALYQEVDGEFRPNHSCGHDAHMTIITGVMHRLQKMEEKLKGTVRAIFQPAEEIGDGAIKVVEEGIIDDLDYLFGVHIRPVNEISFPNCSPGIQHGAGLFLKGQIKGEDHHGARPHEGINAIEVGSAIVHHLQQIHITPQVPNSVKMTNFHAGTKNLNIIPGSATFGLDIRAQTNDVIKELKEKVEVVLQNLSELYGVEIRYEYEENIPAAIIHEEAKEILSTAIIETLGKEYLKPTIITSGSEDFHNYTLLRPDLKATMLGLGADVHPGLHHPQMTFNKEAIENGVNILVKTCLLI